MTGAATLLAKGFTLSLSLLALPLVSHYLGKEQFGLWLLLVSSVNWVMLADLGLANSLVNELAAADGQANQQRAQQVVASACWLSLASAGLLLLLFFSFNPFINWTAVFNVGPAVAPAELVAAVMVVVICFVLRMLASVIGSLYAAFQEGYLYQLWSALCGVLALGGLLSAMRAQAGLAGLLGGFIGGWLAGELIAALYFFGWHRPALRPAWRHFDWARARHLLRNGAQLWVAQVAMLALLQTDLIIVTQLFGAPAVAEYGTALRLFNYLGAVQAAFVVPLWAAYSEALARRDVAWLTRTFRHSVTLSLLVVVPAALALGWLAPWLFRWLVTADIKPGAHLLLALAVGECLNAGARCIAILLNGLGALRSQTIFGPLAGLTNLVLSWGLGKLIGPPGVAWATALCLAVFWLVILGTDARLRLRALHSQTVPRA